ncbi:MAG: 50S ribosomal protein L29 [Candidatus Nanoarchaeia archaeon]|nr:50S ribosomal protein L29 [Candidatus Nanoarchaeia archaeon]MDD5053988.1 50S ribosomal protein L29 [Candidatus Nanoarchaeia archaeon]
MSIIRLKELKEMSKEKLEDKMLEMKKELMKAKTQVSSKQNPDKPGKIKEFKKTIARIKTLINMRGEA